VDRTRLAGHAAQAGDLKLAAWRLGTVSVLVVVLLASLLSATVLAASATPVNHICRWATSERSKKRECDCSWRRAQARGWTRLLCPEMPDPDTRSQRRRRINTSSTAPTWPTLWQSSVSFARARGTSADILHHHNSIHGIGNLRYQVRLALARGRAGPLALHLSVYLMENWLLPSLDSATTLPSSRDSVEGVRAFV